MKPTMLPGLKISPRSSSHPPTWDAVDIGDRRCRVGCEQVAVEIHGLLGGQIVRIEPRGGAPMLGQFRGVSWRWVHHEVVVKDGRVFDLTTGSDGLTIADYKALWKYASHIEFGF